MQAQGHTDARVPAERRYQLKTRQIHNDEQFDEIMPVLLDADCIALDTESNNYNAYNPQLCVLQVATSTSLYVIDTLAVSRGSLQMLGPLLEDPYTTKVIHGADNDLAYLYKELGIRLKGLFDTILAARFLNLPKRGLGDLLERYFQVKSSKQFQRFDWSTRPLPQDALAYAMQDVRYTLPLYELMCQDLEAVGRLDAVEEESALLTERDFTSKEFDPFGYRKLKGAKSLDLVQQGVLYALFSWRHELCTRLNRAAFMVLDNGALVGLATRMPNSLSALGKIRGVSHFFVRDFGEELLNVIEEGRNQRAPVRKRKPIKSDRRSKKERERQAELLERLKLWRSQTAETEQFEIDLVAINATLQHISFHPPADLDALAEAPGMLPWRIKRFGKPLLKLIAG